MKIAILGYGVVGSGVVEVLQKNFASIAKKAGEDIELKYILDIRDFPDHPLSDLFVKDYNIILNDEEIKVVVEVMGGVSPAFEYVKAAMLKGKSVVTSNKELVAMKGAQLLEIALEKNANFLFEASVGGGIPIIRPLHQCLAANEINEITGILNGTTNYILTKMIKESKTFEAVLKEAQELGYAERNPAADVEGTDACRKICILASLAFGKHVYPQNVHTEGIFSLTLDDIKTAKNANLVIKLLGQAKRLENDKLFILVSPCAISSDHPLANVEDVFNGILIKGDAIGDVVFYGRGAGKLPTASAVVADIIDCAKHQNARKWLYWKDAGNNFIADYEQIETSYLVRIKTDNKAETQKNIALCFGGFEELLSLENEFSFITPAKKEKDLNITLDKLSSMGENIISKIRVIH